MKKRILVLLTVVALLVVMLAMSVGPAFAASPWGPNGCKIGDFRVQASEPFEVKADHNNNGDVCVHPREDADRFYDDHRVTN